MAGVKQFDRIDVLDRAMALFWRRGYEATSIQDLVDATGINRGSLYASFTSKKGLFLAVLDHYAEKLGKPLTDALDDPDGFLRYKVVVAIEKLHREQPHLAFTRRSSAFFRRTLSRSFSFSALLQTRKGTALH